MGIQGRDRMITPKDMDRLPLQHIMRILTTLMLMDMDLLMRDMRGGQRLLLGEGDTGIDRSMNRSSGIEVCRF